MPILTATGDFAAFFTELFNSILPVPGVPAPAPQPAKPVRAAHNAPAGLMARRLPEPPRRRLGLGERPGPDDQFDLQRRPVPRHSHGPDLLRPHGGRTGKDPRRREPPLGQREHHRTTP